jgi:C-terminal processing protease CtpA/Prc
VIVGSPAHEAGIRPGDELLKIGDEDVTKWRTAKKAPGSYWEQPAGTHIDLTLRRSNETFQTTATLRDILPPKANAR